MMDFTKLKKLSIGGVELKQLFINGVQVWKSGYKNWARYSTEADGVTIYNGGKGYKDGYRVRSGGAEGATAQGACTGFIPVKGGDIIRFSGWDMSIKTNENSVNVSNSKFENVGQFTMIPAVYGAFQPGSSCAAYNHTSVVKESDGVWKWVVPPADSGVAYIRVSGCLYLSQGETGESMIVTVNEEIQ